MMKFIITLAIVFAVIAGGLVALRRGRNLAMPPQDVLDRAKRRERELEEQERSEGKD